VPRFTENVLRERNDTILGFPANCPEFPTKDRKAGVDLALLGGDPGNAILLNGVVQTANLEIGVPGFQPQVLKSTSEFRFIALACPSLGERRAAKRLFA
jgi:hypothetical protein